MAPPETSILRQYHYVTRARVGSEGALPLRRLRCTRPLTGQPLPLDACLSRQGEGRRQGQTPRGFQASPAGMKLARLFAIIYLLADHDGTGTNAPRPPTYQVIRLRDVLCGNVLLPAMFTMSGSNATMSLPAASK